MNKPLTWIQDGEINEDAGHFGGDIQVGPAISVRFRSDDRPEARFEVVMYATAKQYMELDEESPDCPHPRVIAERLGNNVARYEPMPAEHVACDFKPGTVDVQVEYTYRRNGRIENGTYESDDSDHIVHKWVGSDIGYAHNGRTMTEEIEYATADAKAKIMDWVNFVNKYLHWDGVTEPKD